MNSFSDFPTLDASRASALSRSIERKLSLLQLAEELDNEEFKYFGDPKQLGSTPLPGATDSQAR